MSGSRTELLERLGAVRARMTRAARAAGRDPAEVHLVAVAKRKPAELVALAARAGLLDVAESYVQEAGPKIARVRAILADEPKCVPRWHLVGRLQRNKAREAVRLFRVIHSVDREGIAEELERRAASEDLEREVFLQVNLSAEPQKGGVAPDALPALLARTRDLPHLRVVGLMTVPALSADPESSRLAFRRLRELRDALRGRPGAEHLSELSMGMSGDFEVAIQEGATWVRVGSAIFGAREDRA
jgi:pyridoxal phosphate enzyme (YggS family)